MQNNIEGEIRESEALVFHLLVAFNFVELDCPTRLAHLGAATPCTWLPEHTQLHGDTSHGRRLNTPSGIVVHRLAGGSTRQPASW